MKRMLKKLVTSERRSRTATPEGSLEKRLHNIRAIWNNDHHDDVGIEKLFRLFLASSQFLFPGIYIKHYFGKMGGQAKDLAMDVYVLIKVIVPFYLLYYGITNHPMALTWVIWSFIETILYVPSLIFASDLIARPSSYRRSLLLLFFNYFEIILAFAVIYSSGHYLNVPFEHWYDPVYFSFTTMATIGFGEYHPVTPIGKILVCFQSVLFYSFVVLFINFFSNKMESKGYFEHDRSEGE